MSLVVILLSNKNMEAVREAAKNIVAENQERKSTVAELANITAGSFAGRSIFVILLLGVPCRTTVCRMVYISRCCLLWE